MYTPPISTWRTRNPIKWVNGRPIEFAAPPPLLSPGSKIKVTDLAYWEHELKGQPIFDCDENLGGDKDSDYDPEKEQPMDTDTSSDSADDGNGGESQKNVQKGKAKKVKAKKGKGTHNAGLDVESEDD